MKARIADQFRKRSVNYNFITDLVRYKLGRVQMSNFLFQSYTPLYQFVKLSRIIAIAVCRY